MCSSDLAGFNVDFALNRVPSRNTHRASLITFDRAIRTREQTEDTLTQSVRNAMRNVRASLLTYRIQLDSTRVATDRVEATTELYNAGRVQALDRLDALTALLNAQQSRNSSLVQYANQRLQLMNLMESIRLESHGLRFDMSLPMPTAKQIGRAHV